MQIPREAVAIEQAARQLTEIFAVPGYTGHVRLNVATEDNRIWDAIFTVKDQSFALEWKRSGSVVHVEAAIRQLAMAQCSFPYDVIPILAVPYMGREAQKRCAQTHLAWLDLSGNARIITPGIFYQNLGNPNRFRRPGRPESAFGPKGSRIARQLLMEPGTPMRQRAIARNTGLNEGHVSRIVGKLREMGLVERRAEGIRVLDVNTLLDAWREEYRFDRHHVWRGHIAARSGDSLMHAMADTLSKREVAYAATALPAAWLWTRFAAFRLSTVYLSEFPSAGLLTDLGFQEEPRDANTWLVVPNDEGVFDGAALVDGIRCVHPLQIYVDLKDHPERASAAAAALRSRLLFGTSHAPQTRIR